MDLRDMDEFVTHRGKGKIIEEAPFEHIMNACEHLKNTKMYEEMEQNITALLELVIINWQGKHQIAQQGPLMGKAHIYPIRLRQNQQIDLNIFLKKLEKRLKDAVKEKPHQPPKNKKKHDKNEDDIQQYKQPVNIFGLKEDDVLIQWQYGSTVRDITLNIYMKSVEDDQQEDPDLRTNFKLNIYIIENVTDLSEQNMYVFSKGIANKEFIAFVPTFETFQDDNYQGVDKLAYEKYQCWIYHSKKLFADYMYECIKSDVIRGYLPSQCIKLIEDMDYYNLGYRESCRRFDYCLLRAYQLHTKERPLVDFASHVSTIEACINRTLEMKCQLYKTDITRILKVILQQNTPYLISPKVLSIELAFLNNEGSKKTEEHIIMGIRKRLEKGFKQSPLLKHFKDEIKMKPTRGRGGSYSERERLNKLGLLNDVNNLTEKEKLEYQITKLLQECTQKIRNYVSNIKWSQIKFSQRIRPQIPFKIHKSMKEEEDMDDFVDTITSYHSQPISHLLGLYPQDQIGYGLYLLKTAQLSGLLTLSKREINPLVYCNYFQKSTFGLH